MSRIAPEQKRRSRGPRKRHWCFTSYLDVLPFVFDPDIVRYCCFQREICPLSVPERKHWQGYIELFDNMRIGQLKELLGECHLEPRKGSRPSARAYCKKPESSIPDTFMEYGTWRQDSSRKRKLSDMLLEGKMTLDGIIKVNPMCYVRYHRGLEKLFNRRKKAKARMFRENMQVICLIGPTGCGKSRKALSYPDHYVLPAGDKVWLDGYEGEDVFVIDDFYGGIKYGQFLRMLDGHELQLPIKGGFVWAQWTTVIITSNQMPEYWYKKGMTPALRRRITRIVPMGVTVSHDEAYNYVVDLLTSSY